MLTQKTEWGSLIFSYGFGQLVPFCEALRRSWIVGYLLFIFISFQQRTWVDGGGETTRQPLKKPLGEWRNQSQWGIIQRDYGTSPQEPRLQPRYTQQAKRQVPEIWDGQTDNLTLDRITPPALLQLQDAPNRARGRSAMCTQPKPALQCISFQACTVL